LTRIHHLDCCTLCPPAALRLIGGEDMVCHVLAVETERDGLLLVDTGFGTRDCREPGRVPFLFKQLARPRLDEAQTAVRQLAALGFTAADVRHIVVTHLDLDHAGGLHDFPHATVHLHRREHTGATGPGTIAERIRYLKHQWSHGARWETYEPDGEQWLGVPSVRTLAGVRDEIALVPLLGHTRGHSGVAIKDGDRWLLHAGDAIFHHAELTGASVPAGLRAFATMDEHDRGARLASVRMLQDLSRRPNVRITCSHDRSMMSA
jgi:glyoxylase-like metal-dependent hydrolase (beta-lactamase superfamily II)